MSGGGIGYVNIQYIFLLIYEALTGVHVDPGIAYDQTLALVGDIGIAGMVLSVLLLVFVVYVRIRLLQIEHEGFHAREHAEHERYHAHTEHAPKNPRWDQVVGLANSPNESDWRRAILEADIMLASLLVEQGYPGDTLGDQLKYANPLQFTTLNLAWEAHRMRNALAHLGEAFPLSERDAHTTVEQYRRVFEEFDYI
jgi:hypothetical protein